MTKKQETELTAQKETSLTTPASNNPFGRGLEALDVKDIQIPMAMVIQKMSPLLDDPDFPHRPGALVHSILLEALDVPFVPIRFYKDNRFDLPMDTSKADAIKAEIGVTDEMMHNPGKGCVCYSPDGVTGTLYGSCASCGKSDWHGDKAPLCTKRTNIVSMFEGYDFPVVIRFHKTSFKHGKQFLSALAIGGGDIFTRKYKAVILPKSDGKNSWYELTAKPVGKVAPEDLPKYEHWFNTLSQANIVVEEHDEEGEKANVETEY